MALDISVVTDVFAADEIIIGVMGVGLALVIVAYTVWSCRHMVDLVRLDNLALDEKVKDIEARWRSGGGGSTGGGSGGTGKRSSDQESSSDGGGYDFSGNGAFGASFISSPLNTPFSSSDSSSSSDD